jgi:hypothetical protein
MRGQNLGTVGPAKADRLPARIVNHRRRDFGVPDNFQCFAVGVIGDAGKREGLKSRASFVHTID